MKKKGFTLIELLAVIIILAVIALIATPIVLNIIEKTRINAAESSAKGYTKAVEYQITNKGLFDGISYDGEYDVEENELGVVYQGIGPTEGYFVVENNIVSYGELCINGYPIKYENGYGVYSPGEISCSGQPIIPPFEEPEGTNLSELCKDEAKLNEYDSIINYKIKKVEDLVCLSNLSSSGKTFEGKTVMLLSDIDIADSNSYSNSNDTSYGDINGNGNVEGLLTELTTEKGFKPIGNSTTPFSGIFEGYGFTIANLMINRTDINNVGLFGYVKDSSITGLNVENINITGNIYVGGIVGYLYTGTINEIALNGNVSGSSYIGGISGYSYTEGNTITSVLLSDVNVTGSGSISGGILGHNTSKPIVKGIVESGTIKAGQYAGKITGNSSIGTGYVSQNVTVINSGGNNGISYTLDKSIMGLYDDLLDTYIGGDNDSSGYYLDYENEESTKIVVKSIEREPLTFNLKGSGSENEPYIISNAKDWKVATLKLKGDYYFKINNDIDFTDEKFYMLGTQTNYFTGKIIGNNKTIRNATINGYNNLGLIGYNNGGIIEGLNIDNITVNGNNNVGTLIGYNKNGSITGLNVENINITGNTYVGGVVGYLYTGTMKEIALNGNISGSSYIGGISGYSYTEGNKITSVLVNVNVTGSGQIAGGILAHNTSKPIVKGIVESGTIKSGQYAGKITGNSSIGTGYASQNVTVINSGGNNGTSYTLDKSIMGLYDDLLDTYIGGDNDSSGYYLDYENEESTKIIVKAVELEPLTFNLSGDGTEENPYIIASAEDWKVATLKLKGDYYFKINNDIDFTDEKFYMLGTQTNYFTGKIIGNNKTIRNATINGYNNLGLIGYSNGVIIKGLNIDNITVNGNENVGTLIGYNANGVVTGLNVENINITGNIYVGGIVGYLYTGTINEIALNGNVSGSSYIGGISGYSYTEGNTITSVLLSDVNVTGSGSISGGILGHNTYKPIVKGIVESGTIKSGQYAGKITGNSSIGTGYASQNVTVINSGGNNGTSYTLDKSIMGLYDDLLDTYIGGDNDSSGYYLDYENEESTKIIVKAVELEPLTFNLSGDGTEENPYIIASATDWKEATLKLNGEYYFKLNNDIDFENEKFYMLGTSTNYFTGKVIGNNKTIRNATINGYNNLGLIGYNNGGIIEGLNIDNITVNGNENVGTLIGYNKNGSITGLNVENINITGNTYVGGVVGYLYTGTINEIALNGNISGSSYIGGISGYSYTEGNKITSVLVNVNVTGSGQIAGGILAHNTYKPTVKGIVESGTIKASQYAGKITGNSSIGTGYASQNVTVINSGGNNGTSYSGDDINDLGYYVSLLDSSNNPIIESSITGDINRTGYYFDYGNDGYIRVVPVDGIPDSGIIPGTTPTYEIDSNYTATGIVGTTDTTAPTCELYYVKAVSNGIRASFSCTDESGAPSVKSLFDSTTSKSAATFEEIGTSKTGSVSGNTRTVVSTWNTSNTTSQPTEGTCYYFRYGAKDAENNWSTYVTNVCYEGFSE